MQRHMLHKKEWNNMNTHDAGTIVSLPLPDKEKISKSWKKMSGLLLLRECQTKITPGLPTYRPHHAMKTAVRQWHSLSEEMKVACKKRAVKLNMLPVPGSFRSFLKEISKKPKI
eukprot:2119117-Ditylum_brightwellii.AAC.1